MAPDVRRNDPESRYELLLDGEVVGFAEFRDAGDRVILPHTVVERDHRGRGLGNVLIKATLDDLRARGATVVPVCGFVKAYIDEHREYGDLLAS